MLKATHHLAQECFYPLPQTADEHSWLLVQSSAILNEATAYAAVRRPT